MTLRSNLMNMNAKIVRGEEKDPAIKVTFK